MTESSQHAKMAASLALQASLVDEEEARILLALNDQQFAARLAAEAVALGKTITPKALEAFGQSDFVSAWAEAMLDATLVAIRAQNERGAKSLVHLLSRLKWEVDHDRLIHEALDHGQYAIAAWLIQRPRMKIDRTRLNRWIIYNSVSAPILAEELEKQSGRNGLSDGKRNFLECLADDIRRVIQDNAELKQALEQGFPEMIADAIHNCLLVTQESINALEDFARRRPERIPDLIRLIGDDAAECKSEGYTGLAGFYRSLTFSLSQHAAAASQVARAET